MLAIKTSDETNLIKEQLENPYKFILRDYQEKAIIVRNK